MTDDDGSGTRHTHHVRNRSGSALKPDLHSLWQFISFNRMLQSFHADVAFKIRDVSPLQTHTVTTEQLYLFYVSGTLSVCDILDVSVVALLWITKSL